MHLTQDSLVNEIVRIRGLIESNDGPDSKKLMKRCRQLEINLVSKEYSNLKALVNFKYKLIKLEKDIQNNREVQLERNSQILIHILWFIEIMLLFIFSFIEDQGIKNMFLLTFMGLLGAVTYIYVKGIKKSDNFIFRISLAVVFPIIFMNIFHIEDGRISELVPNNLIAFIGGYSAEFVFLLLNKLVDKAMEVMGLKNDNVVEDRKDKEQINITQ
ncbi:hypothetical protein D3C74_241450 [compost metagenome]